MKFLYIVSAFLCLTLSRAQNITTFNKGKVNPKNYNTTIPYKDIRGLVIAEVVIKGKTYNFIVDTGAMSAISGELYEELRLQSGSEINVSDSSNLSQGMKVVTLPPVHVGDIAFEDVPAVVANDGFFFKCLGIDGFIGSNMLRNSVVKFSYKDRTVSFTNKLKNFAVEKRHSAALLKDKMQSNPYLQITLQNPDTAGHETLMFDTGMVGLYDLSASTYASIKKFNVFTVLHQAKGAYSVGINGTESPTDHYMLLLSHLDFAGVTFTNVTTTTTSDIKSRIGSQMLAYGDVIIDYPGRHLYFNPYVKQPINLAEKNWPVQPVMREGKLVVGIVWDPSVSDRISEGDELLKFGEIDFSGVDPCEAFKTDLTPKTDTAVMVVKDKKTGELKKVELIKK